VLGGGGIAEHEARAVFGGGGIAEQDDSAVFGGGGTAEQDASAVRGGGGMAGREATAVAGGGGMAEQDASMVRGGGGIAEQDRAVLGGGGIFDPERAGLRAPPTLSAVGSIRLMVRRHPFTPQALFPGMPRPSTPQPPTRCLPHPGRFHDRGQFGPYTSRNCP
jgi:hypothetical protein